MPNPVNKTFTETGDSDSVVLGRGTYNFNVKGSDNFVVDLVKKYPDSDIWYLVKRFQGSEDPTPPAHQFDEVELQATYKMTCSTFVSADVNGRIGAGT